MEKIIDFLQNIDWIFAAVILIGGRYWGAKFFTISKNMARNFLAFATVFAFVWLGIKYLTVGIVGKQVADLFLTYLFTTSFYELIAKALFEQIEKIFKIKSNE